MSAAYRLLLVTFVTRGRLVFLGLIGAVPVLLALAVRSSDSVDRFDEAYAGLVEAYGLGLLVPVVSLVFASAALGDPAEDGTLVYLWLKPVARGRLVAAALAAALTVSLPMAVVPLAVAVSITGAGGELVGATIAASAMAVAAYCSLFLGLGLRVRRALVWGLAYVLIWEGAVARTARGAASVSVNVHARSLLARLADHELPRNGSSLVAAVVVPLVVFVLAAVVTTRWLARADVS